MISFQLVEAQIPLSSNSIDPSFLEKLLGGEDGQILTFLEQEGLLQQIDLRSLAPTSSCVDLFQSVGQWEANQLLENLKSKTQVNIDYYQLENDSLHSIETPNQYVNMSFQQAIQVGKMPLSFRGDLILRDGQLDTRLTNGSIQFDHRQLIEQLKHKLYPNLGMQQFLDLESNPLNLSPDAQAYLLNELKYQFYQKIITQADFYQLKNKLLHQVDSLSPTPTLPEGEGVKDSLEAAISSEVHSKKGSLQAIIGAKKLNQDSITTIVNLDSLQQKLQAIQAIEAQYQRYWQEKKSFGQASINELNLRSEEFAQRLQKYQDPKFLKTSLLKRTDLSFAERWMLWTKDLEIGLYQLQGTTFTVNNLALNGIHYATEGRKWFSEVAWGRQSFRTNFFPTFSTSLLGRFSGNRNIYASAGIGQVDGDHLRISFLNVREGSQPKDTLFIYPKTNTVISISGKTRIHKSWSSAVELALSDHDLVGTNLGDTNNNNRAQTSAAEISFQYEPESSWLSVGVGYFYVGSRFISLGNPFLLTNRKGLVAKFGTTIAKKLSLNLQGKFGQSISDDALFEGQLSDVQLIGSLNWQIGASNNIQAQFSPNNFRQSGAGEFNVSSYNTLVNVQGIFQHKIGRSELSNIMGYTNFRSNFTYYDTSSLDRSHYLFLQEAMTFSSGHSISAVATLGGADLWQGTIAEVFTQGSFRFQAKTWSGSLGLQVLKDRFYDAWQYGINSAWQVNIGKNLRCGVDFMLQQGFKDLEGKNNRRFMGHSMVGWRF